MATDKLNQAILEQKMGSAEKDALEIITRALNISPDVVKRVVVAFRALAATEIALPTIAFDNPELEPAIQYAVKSGAARLRVRECITKGTKLPIDIRALVPADDKSAMCNGCDARLPCLADNLSTPEACYTGTKQSVLATPLRIIDNKIEVHATQPGGIHRVPLTAIYRGSRYVEETI